MELLIIIVTAVITFLITQHLIQIEPQKDVTEINNLKGIIKAYEKEENELKETIEQQQKYLERCWQKIEDLEPTEITESSGSYGGCRACGGYGIYCSCTK
jgi:predicted P-loop ATPase/GTPase